MASSPPFQVEDTDEDFFDKLVNDDDDDYKVTPLSKPTNIADGTDSDDSKAFASLGISDVGTVLEPTNIADGNDSDDAKAFASLGISDVGTVLEDTGKVGIGEKNEDMKASSPVNGDIKGESTDTCVEPSHKLVSSNSFAFDSLSEEQATGLEEPLDSTTSWNHGSGDAPAVKEVQWTAFTTEPVKSVTSAFGSYDDFFTEFGENSVDQIGKGGKLVSGEQNIVSRNSSVVDDSFHTENVNNYSHKFQEVQGNDTTDGQDPNSTQYWENLYPGWKYDANTGQWYQVNEGYDAAANVQGAHNFNTASEWPVSNEVSYLQQTLQSVVGAVAEKGRTESVTSWNSVSQVNHTNESLSNWDQASQQYNGYPSHMVFDPQYPGWYYDMNTQEWCSLDAYNSKPTVQPQDQVNQNGFSETNTYYGDDQKTYNKQDQLDKQSVSEVFSSQGQDYKWEGSFSNIEQPGSAMWQSAHKQADQNGFSATNTYYQKDEKAYGVQDQLDKQSGFEGPRSSQGKEYKLKGSFHNVEQQGSTMWQPDTSSKSAPMSDFRGYQFAQNSHGTRLSLDNHVNQHQSFHHGGTASSFMTPGQLSNEFPAVSGAQSFAANGNLNQPFSHSTIMQNEMMNVPKTYDSQKQSSYSQQPVQSGYQVSYASTVGRSSAGCPPHALVTFGFGGKLIVMKDTAALMNPSYSQDSNGGSISVHSLAEVFTGGANMSSDGASVCDYFDTLGLQSFPGPLAGGNVSGKELSKWIDERITHSESSSMDYRNNEVLKLLLSLLKIASQHYGKLRSPFGTDATLKENDAPEVAVAKLFASARKSNVGYGDYGNFTQCLQQLPSERETQVTAGEVQTLLVSGRKIEALQRAEGGQLWGPALVLAAQLGDQFYVDTVRKMALRQFVAGSPLRTLCLLIAGQPADAFSSDTTSDGGISGAVNMSQQPAQAQPGSNCMLEDWEENLAMITANRTKDDELVLIHLGDCLWKERSDIIAAHICYLVAEANFEPYSDTARLCLIGADHWKHPRTYASPEAIQRTEVYEYAKLLGNSQFTLLPFQPYKLLYAHMLAEVGKVSDSLKYCQSVLKSIKTSRAPEVETWRQMVSSLEDRIKTHQQGGFSTNLAPAKLVGKLLNLFDSTAHRVVGGLPPPVPSTSGSNMQNDHHHHHQPTGPRVSTSQSTMAMSSLVPSASMEPINQWSDDANRNKIIHNRSVSEPDFGRSPKQVDPSKENSAGSQNKASGGTSRFGRFSFGSQLLQKTVGLVLKPRADKQAKLGDTNKFYYDEKLKRWVEEGVDLPAEEAALPPPPTMAAFQNGRLEDYSNLKNALKSEASQSNGSSEFTSLASSSGIPPIPAATSSSNQFSARGRLGVRARYVDTFNQGGPVRNTTNLFHSPPTPAIKPTTNTNPNPKFFVPAPSLSPSSSSEQQLPVDPPSDNTQSPTSDVKVNPSFSSVNNSLMSFPPAMARLKFSSMDNVSEAKFGKAPGTRRIASWSGNEESFSLPNSGEQKPTSFMPTTEAGLIMHSSVMNDELQDVDL